jgi:hypothetical protein
MGVVAASLIFSIGWTAWEQGTMYHKVDAVFPCHQRLNNLPRFGHPSHSTYCKALYSSIYYSYFGIGGMVVRGYERGVEITVRGPGWKLINCPHRRDATTPC